MYGATSGRYVHWDESNDSLDFKDSVYARFGTGNDLNIYHDASHSMINAASGTGALKLKSDDIRLENASANNVLKAVGDGYVTMPLQPAFLVTPSTAQNNLSINSDNTIAFGTEIYDVGSNFASNTFTAPVTGKYQLNINLRLNNVDSAADYYTTYIITSNRAYYALEDPGQYNGDIDYKTYNFSVLADMDASDTAYISVYQSGGTAQSDTAYESGGTTFSGYLVA